MAENKNTAAGWKDLAVIPRTSVMRIQDEALEAIRARAEGAMHYERRLDALLIELSTLLIMAVMRSFASQRGSESGTRILESITTAKYLFDDLLMVKRHIARVTKLDPINTSSSLHSYITPILDKADPIMASIREATKLEITE